MKTRLCILCAVLALCLLLSSCNLLFRVGSIIDYFDETDAETETFDRGDAFKIIPDADLKYFLPYLNDVYLENLCGLYSAVSSFSESYAIKGRMTRDDAISLFRLLTGECPELFQLEETGGLRIEYMTGSNSAKRIYLDYRMSKSEYESKLHSVKERIEAFASSVSDLTDYEKEVKAFDYIAKRCVYDGESVFADSAYGSLVLGKAKCDGISRGFKWLCEAVGIQCLMITAVSKDTSIGHAWNMVKIDGDYYNVDLTQSVRTDETGDPDEVIYYYFNVPDSRMSEKYSIYDHVSRFAPLPVCNTYEKSYYAVNGIFIYDGTDPYGPLNDALADLPESGSFSMHFESAFDAERFNAGFPGRIKEWLAKTPGVSHVNTAQNGDRLFTFSVVMKDK